MGSGLMASVPAFNPEPVLMQSLSKFVAIAVVSMAAACGGGGGGTTGITNNPGGPSNPSNPSNPVVTTAVTIGDDFFDPANIQVSPGATVTWTWPSGVQVHNVTFSDQASGNKRSEERRVGKECR